MFGMKSKVARGALKVYTGGWMRMEGGGITPAYSTVRVKVLEETADAYKVAYTSRMSKKVAALCTNEWVQKSDDKRSLSYTVFTATDDKSAPAFIKAVYKVSVLIPMKGMLAFGTEQCDVQIIDQTETDYRLQFAKEFAKDHPNLCNEWIKKDDKSHTVEIAG